MSCTRGGGDRNGFTLDINDRNRRHLAGSADHEGANLKRKILGRVSHRGLSRE